MIANFLSGLPSPNPHVYSVLRELLAVSDSTFTITDTPDLPPHPHPSPLSYFPCLPELRASPIYEADSVQSKKEDPDACRKTSYGHPTLSPGIFTLYCQHGVCYGFEVMARCESPRIPFEIFSTRFPRPPRIIVYDNACKLHAYCLNREPRRFQGSMFAVDRFHWKGHIGCCSGYNLDLYKDPQLRGLNTQVNEQANADLQKIRGQLAYMTPHNFKFHLSFFLAIKNTRIISTMDVSHLHIS